MVTETNSTRTEAMLADKVAGMTYKQVASKHGVSFSHCVRVVLDEARRLNVRLPAYVRKGKPTIPALPKPVYDLKWVARVKARCLIDENGCWIWQGFTHANGYGGTNYRGDESVKVHRKMLELKLGVDLTPDEYACHTCDVKLCCNPEHLWRGSAAENNMDSRIKGRHYEARRDHCERGHPFSDENTRVNSSGSRVCMTCVRGRQRIKSGWPEHLAYSPPIPPSARTERRRFSGRSRT